MAWNFLKPRKIQTEDFYGFLCRRSKWKKYNRLLHKTQTAVEKEFDLIKFFRRQRITAHALLALLNGRQQFVVDKMSNLLVHESSLSDSSSDDA